MSSDSSSEIPVPRPQASDSPEVVRCLEAAREMWELGQRPEAVRWVQRGAEAAEQHGDDLRALGLARLGADLSALAKAPAQNPEQPVDQSAVATPIPGATAALSVDVELPAEAPAPAPPSPESPPSVDAPPVSEAPPTPPVAVVAAVSKSVAPVTARAPSASPSQRPSVPRVSTLPKPVVVNAAPAASAEPAPVNGAAAQLTLAELIAQGRTERVSVKRSQLDASVLVARSGGKATPGTRQALLVYVDSDEPA